MPPCQLRPKVRVFAAADENCWLMMSA